MNRRARTPLAIGETGEGAFVRRAGAHTSRSTAALSFAERLAWACDEHPQTPARNHGRQAWIHSQLDRRFGMRVSRETISKWFTGVAQPRPAKTRLLADLLEVDEAWLVLGVAPIVEPSERPAREAVANGAVNILAGFVQLCGGHAAFPDRDMPQGGLPDVDLYAIIRGAHYPIHVVLAQAISPDTYSFDLGQDHERLLVVGVVQREPLVCDFMELPTDMIRTLGVHREGRVEVTVGRRQNRYVTGEVIWPRIETFAKRL